MKEHRSRPLGDLYSSPLQAESETTDKFMKKIFNSNDNLKVKCSSNNTASVPSLCVSAPKSPVQCNKEIIDLLICNPDPGKTPTIFEDQGMPQTVYTSQTAIRDSEEDDQQCQAVEGSCQREVDGAISMSNRNIGGADVRNVTPDGPSSSSSIEDNEKCSVKAQNHSAESSTETVNFSSRLDPLEASAFRDEKDGDAPQNVVHLVCGMKQGVSSPKEVVNSKNLGLNHNGINRVSSHSNAGHIDGSQSARDCLDSSEGNKHLKCNVSTTNMCESLLHGETKIANDGAGELIDVRVCDICGDVGREALLALCSKCTDGAEHIYCMRVKMDTVPEQDWVCEDCMTTQDSRKKPLTGVKRSDPASKPSYLKESGKGLVDEMRKPHYATGICLSGKKRRSDTEGSSLSKRRILEGNVRPLKLSASRGITSLTRATSLKIMDKREESPSQIYSCDDLSAKKVMEKAPSPSGLRSPKSSQKSKTVQKNVQPLKSYSARKTLLTRVSSLKVTDKRKVAVWKSTSIDDQSCKKMEETCLSPSSRLAKPQQHVGEGYGKGKVFKRSNSTVGIRRPREDVRSEINYLRDGSDCQMSLTRPKKKLVKSMSFSGVRTGLNKPNSHFPHVLNVKGLKYSGGEKSTEKFDSSENRGPRGIMPVARSRTMRVNTSRSTLASDIVKTPCSLKNNVQDGATKANTSRTMLESKISKVPCSSRNNVESTEAVQEYEHSNAKALASSGSRKSADTSAKSIRENMLSSDAKYEISSPKNANSDANRSAPLKVELDRSSGVDNGLLVRKVPLVDSHPIRELPSSLVPSGSTVPSPECIWKGVFELEYGGKLPKDCNGIQAHLSTCASSNALESVQKFLPKIVVKQVARLDIWSNQFERNYPTEQDVAIYFFAEDLESYSSNYKRLLDEMMESDLALEANFDGFQLLIFPSSLLPAGSQRWNALFFLWGVFRVKTRDNYVPRDCSLNAVSLKQGLETFDPLELQCLESTKTRERGGEDEVSSKEKCFSSQETLLCEPAMVEVTDDTTEKKCFSNGVQCSDDFQKEDGQINPPVVSLGKTDVLPYDESDKENPVLLSLETSKKGFCSDGDEKLPLTSFAWTYDPASKSWLEKRLDVASWSSISVDSGPSGSSDGGGCAKSDEGQVEQLQDPSNNRALNLDLCLGPGWDPQGSVDLDLVLSLSKTSKYEYDHFPRDNSYDKGDLSLALSLGMPYSNG